MLIGGGKLCEFNLRKREQVLMQSQYDVEEVSNYAQTLNPLNLFWHGSEFLLGRLFLTDHRLILLPYSQEEVDKAQLLQNVSYKVLDKIGFGIPKPEIKFAMEPVVLRLDEIHSLNPFERQFGIHPTLSMSASQQSFRFKFVPGDSPQEWANAIAELTPCEIGHRRSA
jgi:hypothetical protein